MNFIKLFSLPIMALIIFTSCSGGAKTPVTSDLSMPDSPEMLGALSEDTNRDVLSVYDVVIDSESQTIVLTPSERIVDYHFPLTQLYPNVLQIVGYGWTPNFWADIKLRHPFPGSGIDAFDPRVIAILPANPGVSFNYPVFNCVGNNSVVMEPDGYTKLFDNLGGSIPGNTNPFKAYFKDQPYRVWSSTGVTQEIQRWQMNLSGFGGPMQYKLVVDVSTNYPNAPQQILDNAPEPIEIKTTIGDGLTSEGGTAPIEVTFLDWQGASEIKCKVEAPDLFSSAIQIFYAHPGTNPNEYVFEGTISNSLIAPLGEYNILIASWDIPSDTHIFSEEVAYVSGVPENPIDVTPPWLNFSPLDIFIDGDYAYVAGGVNGLHIFDVSNPVNPAWLNWIDTIGYTRGVYVSDGYAYVAADTAGLQIIDIEPLDNMHILNTVDTAGNAYGIYVCNGYAYIADYEAGLQIINIELPNLAYIVKTVATPNNAEGVYISNDYAYIADHETGLIIIDIDPPSSAYIVKMVNTSGKSLDVYVLGSFAYVADSGSGLQIIDIDPPDSANIVKTVNTLMAFMYPLVMHT
jgi:hypothetical protein